MDKRYTNPRLREKFNRAILEEIQDMEAKVVIEHLDSRSERGLQVADAIAYGRSMNKREMNSIPLLKTKSYQSKK